MRPETDDRDDARDPDYLLGLDLGQRLDYTALGVLERRSGPAGAVYGVTHLERFRGVPYPEIPPRVAAVEDRIRRAHEARVYRRTGQGVRAEPSVALVVDQTGVGAPVVDLLRAAGLAPVAVTIHGGDRVTREGRDVRVPKRDLAAAVAVALQTGRLKIAPALPLAETLRHELEHFKVALSAAGHDRYGAGADALSWREQPHDDLVLAVALALWHGENRGTVEPLPDDLNDQLLNHRGVR